MTKGQNSTLSDYGHVAYQFKGNNERSSMVANILTTVLHHPLPIPDYGGGVNSQNSTYSEHGHVVYQIGGKIVATIVPAAAPTPSTLRWVQKVKKINFFRTWSCYIFSKLKLLHAYLQYICNIRAHYYKDTLKLLKEFICKVCVIRHYSYMKSYIGQVKMQ